MSADEVTSGVNPGEPTAGSAPDAGSRARLAEAGDERALEVDATDPRPALESAASGGAARGALVVPRGVVADRDAARTLAQGHVAEDEAPRALDWIASASALRRLALRVAVGEAPALVALVFGAPPELSAFLAGAGLVPALLAPVALWAEARAGALATRRRARVAAQVLATALVLAAPLQTAYVGGVLAGGPTAGLDAVALLVARLPQADGVGLATVALLALAIGAGCGGLAGARAAELPGAIVDARTLELATPAQVATGAALAWTFGAIVPVALFVLAPMALREASPWVGAGIFAIGVMVAFLIAAVCALFASLLLRAAIVVDVLADALEGLFFGAASPEVQA